MTDTIIIIPARLASQRFPNKMLADLNGRSVIQHTYASACSVAGVSAVYVATDSTEIADNVHQVGAKVIMTDTDLRNGTERVAQALTKINATPDLVINFQGDAPLTPAYFVEQLISAAAIDTTADMFTPAIRCTRQALLSFQKDRMANRVGGTLVVFDNEHRALYFSKEIIPYTGTADLEPIEVFHHVGLYAYRPKSLDQYFKLPQGRLEILEGLEQLRLLENSMKIQVVVVPTKNQEFWEINHREDILIVEKMIANMSANTSKDGAH